MLTALALLMVLLLPFLSIAAVVGLVEWAQRARREIVARQVAVTDAIHRELGAVVAPVVTKRAGGPWRVRIAVPFERPAIVGQVLAIAHRALVGPERPARRLQIVLTSRGDAGARPR